MPFCVHAFVTFFFALEADSSGMMLFCAMFASAAAGAFLSKRGYDPVTSAAAAGWPAVLGAWKRAYWAVDLPSPGGAAQGLARSFGWPDPQVSAAVASVLAASGLAGWLFMRFDRWYEKKTGRSLFEES